MIKYGETNQEIFWQDEVGQMFEENKLTGQWRKYTVTYFNGKVTGSHWEKVIR